MPNTNKCHYYMERAEIIEDRQVRSGRSKTEPQYSKRIWCTHEQSPCRKNEKGVLECQGDVNKCPFGVSKE